MAEAKDRAGGSAAEASRGLEPATADLRRLADAVPQLARIADGAGSIVWDNRRWCGSAGTAHAGMRGRGATLRLTPAAEVGSNGDTAAGRFRWWF